MNIYVPGSGNTNAKIVLLGEAPSYEEELTKKPFVGPSGRFLDRCLAEAGLKREDCWVTNVSKYAVPANPRKGKKIPFQTRAASVGINLENQIHDLRQELAQINPNVIVPLGSTALWAISNKSPIQKWRGSITHGMGYKIVPTYHPAHILHQDGESSGYWNKHVMVFDLKRAKAQSTFKEIHAPSRVLHVIEHSSELYEFLRKYRDSGLHPSIDIEAYRCIPICVGISYEKHYGITVPLWNCEGISNLSDSDLANCWAMLGDMFSRSEVVGQNFGYDRDKLLRLGMPIKGLHSDTMLKAFTINPELPKNLAFLMSIYTEEPYYKDEGMYEGSFADLFIGCARDACVTKEVDDEQEKDIQSLSLESYYREFILPLHDVYSAIERRGLRTKDDKQREIIKKYLTYSEEIGYQLYKICGERINVNSPKQVAELLYNKWKLPMKAGTGEDELTKLLNDRKVKEPAHRLTIEKIIEKRQVDKTIGTYAYGAVDFDGRMRTSYFLCLKTGRSSTAQQEAPIRPTIYYKDVDGKKKNQSMGMAFQTITKHGEIGSDIRTIFVPEEGEIFLQVDSMQAEARVIFLLAEDYQALKDIDTVDYHALTASWFFGGTEQDHSKKVLGFESPIRFAGKTLRHAIHLGCGEKTAAADVNNKARKAKINYKISVPEAKRCIETFHKKQPSIKNVFQKQVIECLQKNKVLIAPVPYGIPAKVGGRRLFFERESDQFYREAFSYIPQRAVSENTKGAATRIYRKHPWIKVLVEAHDGLLVSVPIVRKREAASILRKEMEVPIDFSTCSLKRGELVIPCEIEEGYDYKNLHKYKDE